MLTWREILGNKISEQSLHIATTILIVHNVRWQRVQGFLQHSPRQLKTTIALEWPRIHFLYRLDDVGEKLEFLAGLVLLMVCRPLLLFLLPKEEEHDGTDRPLRSIEMELQ